MDLLIVDDESDIIDLLRLILERDGHLVRSAKDGAEAINTIRECRPDAVLSDICMPDVDGLDLLEWCSKQENGPPIILLTSYAGTDSAIRAVQLGAFDYLTKPLGVSRIRECLARLEKEQYLREESEKAQIDQARQEGADQIKKVSQAALAAIERRYEAVVKDLPVYLCRFLPDGSILFVNDAYGERLGSTVEIVRSDNYFDLMESAGPLRNRAYFERLTKSDPVRTAEFEQAFLDGYSRWERWTDRAIFDENDNLLCYQSIGEDITDQHKLEEQLQRSERLQAIGQLAAGVAHEINNPIAYLSSNLDSLQDHVRAVRHLLDCYRQLSEAALAGKDTHLYLKQVEEVRKHDDIEFVLTDLDELIVDSKAGTARVRDIVQSLKRFAHPDDQSMHALDINTCINQALQITGNEIKHACSVKKLLDDIPLCRGNDGQITQVFANLFVNAAHAMQEKGGTLSIHSFTENNGIAITVSDTGSGIPAHDIEKLFDPFYTTKAVGQGTGLGLAICHRIIERHKGRIDVESQVGRGTSFTLWFPALQEEDESAEADNAVIEQPLIQE